MFSCINNDEQYRKDIVGTFTYSEHNEQGEGIITVESNITYQQEGKVKENGIYTMTFFDDNTGKINLKYKISLDGTYTISNAYLLIKYNLNSFKMDPITSNSYLDTYMYENLNSIVKEHFIPAIKQELSKNGGGKIVELNKERLVLADRDGKQLVMRRSNIMDLFNR
jgi:hypothetical protein